LDNIDYPFCGTGILPVRAGEDIHSTIYFVHLLSLFPTEILPHSQQAMFQAFRSSHSPAPDWKSGRGGAMDETRKIGLITLDFRFWILDFGFWILDFGLGKGCRQRVS
jgi:hypothetical protein